MRLDTSYDVIRQVAACGAQAEPQGALANSRTPIKRPRARKPEVGSLLIGYELYAVSAAVKNMPQELKLPLAASGLAREVAARQQLKHPPGSLLSASPAALPTIAFVSAVVRRRY